MDKPFLKKNKKYHQGIFSPKHPEKYIGNPTNIIFRSGWEKLFLKWCDMTPNVLKYGSEELVIPYVSPLDEKIHRYFVDFVIYVLQSNGEVQKFAIEIKPYSQTVPPKTKFITEAFKKQADTFMVNQAKWKSAREYCKRVNMNFIILTEKELLKKR